MTTTQYMFPPGPFEARCLAFLATVTQLRPALHRYCARMAGSVNDGEDVVQEAVVEAYRSRSSSTVVDRSRAMAVSDRCTTGVSIFSGAAESCATRLKLMAAVPEAVQATETVRQWD